MPCAISQNGTTGLTRLRTQAAVGYTVSESLAVSLGYLRQQDIQRNRASRVGHAPIVGIEFSY